MPRKRNGRKSNKGANRRTRGGGRGDTLGPASFGRDRSTKITKVTFRLAAASFTSSTTGGTVTVTETQIYPANFGARGLALSDLFQYYRIVGIRITGLAHPGFISVGTAAGNTSWYLGVNLAPISTYTAPTTVSNFIDTPHMCIMQDFSPNRLMLTMNRRDLMRNMPQKWLKTVATGVNDEEYIQGAFTVLSVPNGTLTISSVLELTLEFDVEFAGPIDPALIPGSPSFVGNDVRKVQYLRPARVTVTPRSSDQKEEKKTSTEYVVIGPGTPMNLD